MNLGEINIDFLRRLLVGDPPEPKADLQPGPAGTATSGPVVASPPPAPATAAPPKRVAPASCPYCAVLLDPPPERGRLCPRCRRRIVVRRVNGRLVYLTEEAVNVFEAQRDRETREHTWAAERDGWLALARGVSAPDSRIARLSTAQLSDAVVAAAKDLYLAAAEHAVRTARHEKRWEHVARIRRAQAAALYHASGSVAPPTDEVVALHREWSAAALRSIVRFGKEAELVSEGCCAICRRDDGRAYRIADELRTPRLPHAGCPRGLCPCDWFPVPDTKVKKRVRRRVSPRPSPAASPAPAVGMEPEAGPEFEVGSEPEPLDEPPPELPADPSPEA